MFRRFQSVGQVCLRSKQTQLCSTSMSSSSSQRRFFSLNKDPHVEEWTGLREETTKTFEINRKNIVGIVVAAVVFPAVSVYFAILFNFIN